MAERRAAEVPPQHTHMIESCGMCSTLICPHGLCRTCSRCEQCEENLTLLELPRCAARLTPAGEGSPSAHRFSRPRVRAVTELSEERFGLVGRVHQAMIDPSQDAPGPRDEPEEVDAEAEPAPHHRCTPRYPDAAYPDSALPAEGGAQ